MNQMTIKYGNMLTNVAKGTRFIRLLGTARRGDESPSVKLDVNELGPDAALFSHLMEQLLLKYGKPEQLGNGRGKEKGVSIPCVILEADDGFSISQDREKRLDPKTGDEVWGDYQLYLNGGAMRLLPRKASVIG